MTVLGVATIVAIVAVWFARRRWTQFVVGATLAFPQTAGLLVGGNGIPLFYVAVVVILVLAIPRGLMSLAAWRPGAPPAHPASGRLAADLVGAGLVLWGAVISFVGPRIFAGIGVYDPKLGVDVLSPDHLPPLAPSLGNVSQVGYLAMGVLFVVLAGRLFPVDRRLDASGLWVAIVLAAVRLVGERFWPASLLQNMPGYNYQPPDRLSGTFYEPSVLGLVLVAATGYFGARLLLEPGRRNRLTALVALALIGVEFVANRSGTVLVGLAILLAAGVAVLLVRGLVHPVRRVLTWPLAGALLAFAGVMTQLPAIIALTIGSATSKTDTSSFANRTAADGWSWELFLRTSGLGVGLGSNRPSSLFFFVLGCTGVIGVLLLLALVVLALRAAFRLPGGAAVAWTLIGALVAAVVAVPDLSMPILWACLAACLAPLSARVQGMPRGSGLDAPSADRVRRVPARPVAGGTGARADPHRSRPGLRRIGS